MGNCTASRLVNGEEDAVDLCRERKRLLRSAVDRRHVLADAHFNSVLSLRSVAAAINLFVALHGSSNPTLPPPPPHLLLQQTPTQPKTQSLPPIASSSSSSPLISMTSTTSTSSCLTNVDEIRCGYFYSGLPMMPVSPINDLGWDFFNPFDGVRAIEEEAMLANLCRNSDKDLRVVRGEGIPMLQEAEEEEIDERGERNTELCNGGQRRLEEVGEERERGLTVTERTEKERELLDALRDVEDQFIRAFDCGKEVSRMFEVNNNDVNKVDDHLQSFHLDEVKGDFYPLYGKS